MGNQNIEALAKGMDPAALAQLIEALKGNTEEPVGEGTDMIRADQYRSLGFVIQGSATPKPAEGDIVEVPTKSGKVKQVQLVDEVDVSDFVQVPEGSWTFTLRELKRGRNVS